MHSIVGGISVWFMPFAVSCFLIEPGGKKLVSDDLFKTAMLLVGSVTASYCTYACDPKSRREGMRMALVWLSINWLLDLIVLVPLMVFETGDDVLTPQNYAALVPVWFKGIGLTYVGFVSMCVVAGACSERARKTEKRTMERYDPRLLTLVRPGRSHRRSRLVQN